MECNNCGAVNEEANFCSKCGTKLEAVSNLNLTSDVPEEKKEMTKKELKEMKKQEKKIAKLNKKFNGDQELVTKYLNAESNGHIVMFLFGLVTIVNHYFFQSTVLGAIGWLPIIFAGFFIEIYRMTKCKKGISIVLTIVSVVVFFIFGALITDYLEARV